MSILNRSVGIWFFALVLVMLSSLSGSHLAFAGEEPKGKEEAKGAEKGGEKGKEGGKEEGKGEGKGEKKELPEWVEIQTQISTLDSRIIQKKETIAHLIEEKQHLAGDNPHVKEIIDDMVSNYKEMRKLQEDFEKKMIIYKFRYPERGAKEDRKYGPIEIKSLEQMEQELGLEGRLNRNIKKMRTQYQSSDSAKGASETSGHKAPGEPGANPHEGSPDNISHEKSIDDAGTIIIKK